MLHTQFHMRALAVREAASPARPQDRVNGLLLVRQETHGDKLFPAAVHLSDSGREGTPLRIQESRTSVAILTSIFGNTLPHYAMVTLTDTEAMGNLSIDCIDDQSKWGAHGIRPLPDGLLGLAIFQLAVGRMIAEWARQWRGTLDVVGALCSRQDQAETRLIAAQLLLFQSRKMIQEFRADVESLVRDMAASIEVITGPNEAVRGNWDALCWFHGISEAPLLAEIQWRLKELAHRVQTQTRREEAEVHLLPLGVAAVAATLLFLGWTVTKATGVLY